MKANFQEQFLNLRKIIQTNVSTLKDLLKQSESLSEIIRSLGEGEDNSNIKHQLAETKKKISDSIEILVDQTAKLFESYDKLVEEIFGKK
jgi:hypothetical protein